MSNPASKHRMRYLVPLAVLVAIVAGLGTVKFKQIQTLLHAKEVGEKMGPPPEVVGTAVATEEAWEGTLSAVGTVAAVRGVAVSNESPGVVTAIHFESGQVVKAGQVLVELDTSVERAQLASAEARKDLAAISQTRSRALVEREAASKAQLDSDEAQLKSSGADFSALKAQIERKTVRAPFAGRLGIRTVNLGQYLQPGTPVSVLESLGAVYVDFSLPQQYLGEVKPGTPVRVHLGGTAGDLDGTVGAVDPTIDSMTRAIKLRASVPNKRGQLHPGMFVNVEVVRGEKQKLVIAPLTAVVHASYGDSVFVVEDKKDEGGGTVTGGDGKPAKMARQQFVRLGPERGDFVAIVDGVKPGQTLVTVGAFKLRNNAGIVINNAIKPTPSLAPHVDNL
jgi:membrane fusion protein (multidrug efflux system)